MTAFEILLNTFYETIEQNEPVENLKNQEGTSKELSEVIRNFINTSFINGHNLSYKNLLTELMQKGANLLRHADHEEWSKVKYAFQQNDLHIIRKDRNMDDVQSLKMKLDQLF